MQFLTHFVSFDIPEWLLIEQVDDCEQLSIFLDNEECYKISKGEKKLDLEDTFPMRKVIVNR